MGKEERRGAPARGQAGAEARTPARCARGAAPTDRGGQADRQGRPRARRRGEREGIDVAEVRMKVWRGDSSGGEFVDYSVPTDEGMVVLDVVHRIQATHAPD